MNDIRDISDIKVIVKSFYEKAFQDDKIGFMFTEVAKINLIDHIPSISKFWENALFHTGGYKKNVTQIHLDLDKKSELKEEHFDRWLQIWESTVDENRKGDMAEKMKKVGNNVAIMLKVKLGKL